MTTIIKKMALTLSIVFAVISLIIAFVDFMSGNWFLPFIIGICFAFMYIVIILCREL